MSSSRDNFIKFSESPILIIDGDRGKNYPSQEELHESGYCLFLNAGNVTKDGFVFGKNQFITKEKDLQLRKGRLTRGDIVLTTRGTVGNVALFNDSIPFDNIRINSGMVIFRNTNPELISTKYFYYYLRSSSFFSQVFSHSSGSAQPQLPIKDLREIVIPLPSISEQCNIAEILSALDDKIELNRQTNATLEAIAQAIFKEWFVDFNYPGATGEMVDSELGLIPRGWDAGNLGDIITQRTERIREKSATILSAVASGELIPSDDFFSKRVYSKDIKNYLLVRQWDFAYNPSRINIGSIGLNKNDSIGAVSPVYVVFSPKKDFHWFIEFFLRIKSTKIWINTLASGSVRQALPFKELASIPLVIPSLEIIYQFNAIWDDLFHGFTLLSEEAATLQQIRDSLANKLISGELELKI